MTQKSTMMIFKFLIDSDTEDDIVTKKHTMTSKEKCQHKKFTLMSRAWLRSLSRSASRSLSPERNDGHRKYYYTGDMCQNCILSATADCRKLVDNTQILSKLVDEQKQIIQEQKRTIKSYC